MPFFNRQNFHFLRPHLNAHTRARRAGPAGALQHYAQSSLFDLPLYILQEVDVTFPLLAYCIITNAYTLLRKMSETSVKIIEGCRDDTVPKTVETRRHCEVDWEHATIFRNPLPTSWFLGVAEDCCMLSIHLAVPSCFNSFWHGVIPTSFFIFNDFYTCEIGC